MIKAGLCSVSFRKHSPNEVIDLCRMHGVQAIEWGGDIHVPPGTNASDVKKLVSICEASGISTPSYGSYFNVLDDSASSFSPVLETAVELHADTIRIWPGWVEPEAITAEQREKITTTTRAIAEMSAGRGVRVAFEFHLHSPTSGAAKAMKIIEGCAHENVYSYYQFLPPLDAAEAIKEIETIRSRLTYIHCHWTTGEDILPFEQGRGTWTVIVDHLKKTGYEGVMYIEFVAGGTVEQFAKDAKLLKELIG